MNPDEASQRVDSDRPGPAGAEERLRDLSLRPTCTRREITSAYRQLAQQLHPDHGGDTAAFQRLQREYEAALNRLVRPRWASQNPLVLRPVRPLPAIRSARVRLLVLLTVLIAGISYILDADERWILFSLVFSFLILVGLPMLLSGCRPAHAAVLTLIVIFLAGTLLAGIVASGMLREALHPSGAAQPGSSEHELTIVLTLLSAVSILSAIVGFLFSVSDHGLE